MMGEDQKLDSIKENTLTIFFYIICKDDISSAVRDVKLFRISILCELKNCCVVQYGPK